MARTFVDLDDQSLLDHLNEAREELFNLRFQNATGQLSSTARIKQVKREIARCLTEKRAREIAAADALAAAQADSGAAQADSGAAQADMAAAEDGANA